MPVYVSSCAWNKGTRGKGIKDKGALQRQGSWLGWWNSIPRLIFDRHKILWNSYLRFQWEWVLLRVEHIRLCSLHELTFKNSLHMNCCIICCVYSDPVLCYVSQANRKRKEQLDGVSRLCCFVHQGLWSDWWRDSRVTHWSSRDRRERGLRRGALRLSWWSQRKKQDMGFGVTRKNRTQVTAHPLRAYPSVDPKCRTFQLMHTLCLCSTKGSLMRNPHSPGTVCIM